MSLPVFIHRLDMRKTVLSLQKWERCHISSTFTIFKNEQFNDSIHIHLTVYICQCLCYERATWTLYLNVNIDLSNGK